MLNAPRIPLRYGHQVSDLSVFIANVFMLGYALESTVRGYQEVEVCEYPLNTWMVLQSCLIFVLQIFTPLLLILPKTPNVLAPVLSGVLFLTQIVVLLFGWLWVFSPSNCPTSSPFLWNGAYWLVVVYSVYWFWADLVCSMDSHPSSRHLSLSWGLKHHFRPIYVL